MINLKSHIKEINCNYAETMYAAYMVGEWGIKVGYTPKSIPIARMQKRLADWQLSMDCNGALCEKSKATFKPCPVCVPEPYSKVLSYPVWGNSPFPQIYGCNAYLYPSSINVPAVLQGVEVVNPPILTYQYTVGELYGPLPGTTTFTPLDTNGNHFLIGRSIDLFQLTILQAGIDYTFDSTTGTITLLAGRLFNTGEVYSILTF